MTTGSRRMSSRFLDAVLKILQVMGFVGWLSFIVQGIATRSFSWGWVCATAGFTGFVVTVLRAHHIVKKWRGGHGE